MFKVGQEVKCANDIGVENMLAYGVRYTVTDVLTRGETKVNGIDYWFRNDRFVAVESEPKKQPETDYERPVWIVRGPNTLQECDSEASACEAAKDFAKLNAGQFFTVLAPITRYIKSDVEEIQLGHFSSAVEYDEEIAMQNAF